MKSRLASLGCALVCAAGLSPASADTRVQNPALERLNRRIVLEGSIAESARPVTVTLDFTLLTGGRVYYRGTVESAREGTDWYWESEVFARVSAQAGGRLTMDILRRDPDLLTTLSIDPNGRVRSGSSRKIKVGDAREFDGMVPYWYEAEVLRGEAAEVSLQARGSLAARRASDRILSPVRALGQLEFNPCDGCEHGDQFLIEDKARGLTVNVVELGFGPYYEPDCEGTVHPWLSRLAELEVPFLFVGRVTSLSSDYWEGQFWTAFKDQGVIHLGATERIPVVGFLDRMKRFDRDGSFESYRDGVLVFKGARGEVRADLRTGNVRTARKP